MINWLYVDMKRKVEKRIEWRILRLPELYDWFQYSHPLIYYIFPNVWKALYTISASIFVDVPYWPPYSTDKLISCVVPGPPQRFFHFGEEIVIAWTHLEWVPWMFHTASGARGPWQLQPCDSLHCHEEWWDSVTSSVANCFTQSLKTFLCTTTSCHFNFDRGT